MIFLLGFFLDFIEIAVVVVPIVAPILLMDPGANITAVWLGVMIGLNIQTSFLTPPFGFALFYLRGVAPISVKTIQMYKGVVPFIALQLCALAIVGSLPWLVNYLPNRVSLLSDTAPPPVNPRLQYCIENYMAEEYAENGTAIRQAIADARQLDFSSLPKKLQRTIEESFMDAESTFEWIETIKQAEAQVQAASAAYKPLHLQVRRLEKQMRKLDVEVTALNNALDRLQHNDNPDQNQITALNDQLSQLQQQRAALEAQIPEQWDTEHKAFADLQATETKARNTYRRSADNAYEAVRELTQIIGDSEALEALAQELEELSAIIDAQSPDEAADRVADLRSKFGKIAGASKLRSELNKVRKALKARTPDPERAQKALQKTRSAYQDELAWRQTSAQQLLSGLQHYSEAIKDTIGLRSQPRLPKAQALYIAQCNSGHRDISLSF